MLTKRQVKYLKGQAHHLQPTVYVGKHGFSEAVGKALAFTFRSFELIKVKIAVEDRNEVASIAQGLAEDSKAVLVQIIGKMACSSKEMGRFVNRIAHSRSIFIAIFHHLNLIQLLQ